MRRRQERARLCRGPRPPPGEAGSQRQHHRGQARQGHRRSRVDREGARRVRRRGLHDRRVGRGGTEQGPHLTRVTGRQGAARQACRRRRLGGEARRLHQDADRRGALAADTADLVVIGGGIIGCATAFFAQRAGLKTIVLEKRPALATLTTPVATGAFRLQFDNAEEVELVRESVAFFDDLQSRVDVGLRHQGYLFVAGTPEGARAQAELVAAQRGWGLTDVELLDGAQARRRFPYLAPDIVNARFRQGDGWLEPRRLALELARASGARVRTGVTVAGFLVRGDRVRGVTTTDGNVEADNVVIAAGPLSGPVGKLAGLELPLVTVRRQKLILPDLPQVPTDAPMTIEFETGAYWRPARPRSPPFVAPPPPPRAATRGCPNVRVLCLRPARSRQRSRAGAHRPLLERRMGVVTPAMVAAGRPLHLHTRSTATPGADRHPGTCSQHGLQRARHHGQHRRQSPRDRRDHRQAQAARQSIPAGPTDDRPRPRRSVAGRDLRPFRLSRNGRGANRAGTAAPSQADDASLAGHRAVPEPLRPHPQFRRGADALRANRKIGGSRGP